MIGKFFQTISFIFTLLFSTNAQARNPVDPPDMMRTKWWYYGRLTIEPTNEPLVVLPCQRFTGNTMGATFLAGALGQANIGMPIGPEVGIELEFCLNRFSYANWAPSRLGIGLLAGYNKLGETWFTNFGPVIRYQRPITEQLDGGIYWKYNFLTNFIEKADDQHTFVFGILGELRPLYNGNGETQHPLSGIFFTARSGIGTVYFEENAGYGFVFEFLLGAGYRFPTF